MSSPVFALASAASVGLIALVFLFGGRIRFRDCQRRRWWMSAAGGSSAAFVFVVLFPKLQAAQTTLARVGEDGLLGYLSHHSLLLALVGLLVFWGLERTVVVLVGGLMRSLERAPGRSPRSATPLWRPLLYAQAVAFAAYSMLIGYVVAESPRGDYAALGLFSLAMALHCLAMSLSLRHELAEAYEQFERWLLAAAILTGWAVAQVTEVPSWRLALWNSFFAGMIIFYVIRNEIPSPKHAGFVPLLFGAIGYSALALVITAL